VGALREGRWSEGGKEASAGRREMDCRALAGGGGSPGAGGKWVAMRRSRGRVAGRRRETGCRSAAAPGMAQTLASPPRDLPRTCRAARVFFHEEKQRERRGGGEKKKRNGMFITGGMVGNFEQKLPPRSQNAGGSCCENCTMKNLTFFKAPRRKFSLWLVFGFFEKQKQVGSPTSFDGQLWILKIK
jgi:hypothetical protein